MVPLHSPGAQSKDHTSDSVAVWGDSNRTAEVRRPGEKDGAVEPNGKADQSVRRLTPSGQHGDCVDDVLGVRDDFVFE